MRRREFIGLAAGAAAWPLAVRAQQPTRVRRVGVLLPNSETDLDAKRRVADFEQELQGLGWTIGRDLLIEHRWAAGDTSLP
jgi:putative ABC transport system substrate-binding protein